MMTKNFFPALTAFVLTLPAPASALCVLCSCSTSSTPIAFGTYDPLSGANRDSDGSVLFTCGGLIGGTVTYDVALGKGVNSNVFSPRKMASGANLVNYDLYTSSAYSAIWGDGSAGSQTISGAVTVLLLNGTTRELVVYGRIPGTQTTVKAGSYSDAVLITVTYN